MTEGKSYWRDITAMGMNKKVVITFGNGAERSSVYSRRMVQARGNQQKPEVGDVFTGNCVVTAVNGGNGHTVHGVTMGGFTGILAGTQTNYLEDLQFLPPCGHARKKAALTEDGPKVHRTRLFA